MIRLHSLTINRYRGIRAGKIDGFTDVNIFVGRNNSGKTTVVEAVQRLLSSLQGGGDLLGRTFEGIWGQIRQTTSFLSPELWYAQDLSQPILLEGRVGESNSAARDKDLRLTQEIHWGNAVQSKPSHEAFEGGLTPGQAGEFASQATLFRPLDALNREIEKQAWPRLLGNRRDKSLTKILNEIFALQAESFQLLPDNRLVVLFEKHSLPLDVQGDGTRAALRALIMLTMLNRSMFIIEEPECHQHPGSLERLARALCSLARENEVQLVVSTHSGECVRFFLNAAQAAGSEAALFHLSLADGQQQARRLDEQAVSTLLSTGVDIRFLDLYA